MSTTNNTSVDKGIAAVQERITSVADFFSSYNELIGWVIVYVIVILVIQQFQAGRLGRLTIAGKFDRFIAYNAFLARVLAVVLIGLLYDIVYGFESLLLLKSLATVDAISRFWYATIIAFVLAVVVYVMGVVQNSKK